MAIGKEGNVKWVDGLRGFASLLVVATHLARSFDGRLFYPADGDNIPPRLFQWPFMRVLVQGRLGVAIFSFVTGYVCALKPLRLSRQGKQDEAFSGVARSALRRTPRLVLPAALATVLCVVLAELGAFVVARNAYSGWARDSSPERFGIIGAFRMMVFWIVGTWTIGKNYYDGNQWTMMPLLKGSMQVYAFVLATAYVQPRYRMMGALGMWLYMYLAEEPAFGMEFFWGVFMAELQHHSASPSSSPARFPRGARLVALALFVAGLLLASYPERYVDARPWSHAQHVLLEFLSPSPRAELPRYASGLGLQLITLSLHLSPWARDLLANRTFLWLGKQSFAVYLIHGPLLRSVLCWMIFGFAIPAPATGDDGKPYQPLIPYPGHQRLLLCLPVWLPMVYGAAVAWTTYVDPWCARVTERLVAYVLPEPEEKVGGGLLLPA